MTDGYPGHQQSVPPDLNVRIASLLRGRNSSTKVLSRGPRGGYRGPMGSRNTMNRPETSPTILGAGPYGVA